MTKSIAITGVVRFPAPDNPGELTAKNILGYAYKPFGRMDYFSKLGFSGIYKAMENAKLNKWQEKRNIGLIASTVFGCLGTDLDYFATMKPNNGIAASPALFAYTLPNSFLGEAAILLGLTGEAFVINGDDSTGIIGLSMAMTALFEDDSLDAMVCGICDAPWPEHFKNQGRLYEGALFMVLENIKKNPVNSYGTLGFDRSGMIIYNQKTVKDIVELADKVLKGKN